MSKNENKKPALSENVETVELIVPAITKSKWLQEDDDSDDDDSNTNSIDLITPSIVNNTTNTIIATDTKTKRLNNEYVANKPLTKAEELLNKNVLPSYIFPNTSVPNKNTIKSTRNNDTTTDNNHNNNDDEEQAELDRVIAYEVKTSYAMPLSLHHNTNSNTNNATSTSSKNDKNHQKGNNQKQQFDKHSNNEDQRNRNKKGSEKESAKVKDF